MYSPHMPSQMPDWMVSQKPHSPRFWANNSILPIRDEDRPSHLFTGCDDALLKITVIHLDALTLQKNAYTD